METSTVVAWITGIGAILSAGAGVAMIWREVKSRQHKEIKRLDEEVADVRDEMVAWHRYSYDLQVILADHGIDAPPSPGPSPERDYSGDREYQR
jgi:hypothetical protein